MSVIEEIAAERKRQIKKEDYGPDHDDEHEPGELALAAATYAYTASLTDAEVKFHKNMLYGGDRGVFSMIRQLWPWEAQWFKPKNKRRNLIRAGALIVAEIERLDRAASDTSAA